MDLVKAMPDVVESTNSTFNRVIDWVGMTAVEASLELSEGKVPCDVDVFVDLSDAEAKGIHMSRIYLAVSEDLRSEPLSRPLIEKLLKRLVVEQAGRAVQSRLKLSFKLPMMRKALVSQTFGERHYPVEVEAVAVKAGEDFHFDFEVRFKVLYSSTCPCSAALSRQLIGENWNRFAKEKGGDFSALEVSEWIQKESSILATPHAQRSEATLKIMPKDFDEAQIRNWIETLEERTLKTPVQTAVKREDEQEFARLNGTNLMFCEDAARRVAKWLDEDKDILGYWAKLEHRESLHAHNAVSEISNNWRI